MPEVIEEPSNPIWANLKASNPGVIWPGSDETVIGEMALGWLNAGIGFASATGTIQADDKGSWPDSAGQAFNEQIVLLNDVSMEISNAMKGLSKIAGGYADDVRHTKDQISKLVDELDWDYRWLRTKLAIPAGFGLVDMQAELDKLITSGANAIAAFIKAMAARIAARANGGAKDAPPGLLPNDNTEGNSTADKLGTIATALDAAARFVPSPHLKVAAVVLNAIAAGYHVAALMKEGPTLGNVVDLTSDFLAGKGVVRDGGELLTKSTKEADNAWKSVTNNPTGQKLLNTGSDVVTNDGAIKEETAPGDQYGDEKGREAAEKLGIAGINERIEQLRAKRLAR